MIDKDSFKNILEDSNNYNLNNKYKNFINNLPENINKMPNIILYGPSGVGKYSEALKIINNYSKSNLKYEKKMKISFLKNEHIIKLSDIHYEINFEFMTCNAKLLLIEIYNNIIDSVCSSCNKVGIILCKNFHVINNETTNIFYSLMQKIPFSKITLKFIFLTEHISFIPNNLLNVCKILYYTKFSNSNYKRLCNKNNKTFLKNYINESNDSNDSNESKNKDNINNYINITSINILKNINLSNNNINILNINYSLCDKIVKIIETNNCDYNVLRSTIYDLLIYNLNIYESIFYIINSLIKKDIVKPDFLNKLLFKTCNFFKYYNNNYRPIYHLESYILYIIDYIHENES